MRSLSRNCAESGHQGLGRPQSGDRSLGPGEQRKTEVLRDPASPAKANILSYSEGRPTAGESGDELVSGWEEEAPEPDIVGMADTPLEDENDQPADAPEPEPEPELEPEPEPPALEEPLAPRGLSAEK